MVLLLKHQIKRIMNKKNCAFQYAKMSGEHCKSIKIVCDKSELTIEEAKQLWDEYYYDAAKWIKSGNTVEMVIWIDMETPSLYGDSLQYISTDAESDGRYIWETKKMYFARYSQNNTKN